MVKKKPIQLLVLVLATMPNLHASIAVSGAESAREEITHLTTLDLRDYPHYRYLPRDRFGLFARCVAEKQIQMATTIDCQWPQESGSVADERLDRLLECLDRGGFGEAQRESHREFCALLMREHFKALESGHALTHSPPDAAPERNQVSRLQRSN